MKHPSLFRPTRFIISVVAVTFSAPVLAQSSDTNEACAGALMRGGIAQLSTTHATVDTAILIDAAPEQVWETLSDFESMSDWSTGTLQGMTGDIQDGGSVVITFLFGADENGEPIANEIPHTLIYVEGEAFGWSDPFPADIGGGHDNHLYHVQPCGDKTLFVQTDEIVDNAYAANFVTQLFPLYQLFNSELKAAAEN